MIRIKTQKVLHNLGNIFKMNTFFDSIAKNCIQNPIKSLWWSFFAKIVNDFQLLTFFAKKPHHKCQIVLPVKKKEINLYYFTYFYMILYDFINCPAFVDIFFAFLCWIKFCSCCFRQVFFIWESKKVVAGHVKK